MFEISFRKEELSESPRENFVGVVVWAEYPCKCPICERGQSRLNGRQINKIHIAIKPINKYDKLQHTWYPEAKTLWSALGGFVIALNDLLGFVPESKNPQEQWKEVREYLLGRAFEWTSERPVEFVSKVLSKEIPANIPENARKAKEQWFPIHEYSKEEIKQVFGVDIEEMYEIGKRELEDLFEQVKAEQEFFEEQLE